MGQDALQAKLFQIFGVEMEERLQDLNDGLLALEQAPEREAQAAEVARLFRAAHSLKGAARSVGLAPVEALCHEMETAIAKIRDEESTPSPELIQSLFSCVDALNDAREQLKLGPDLAPQALRDAQNQLVLATDPLPASTAPKLKAPARPVDSPPKPSRDSDQGKGPNEPKLVAGAPAPSAPDFSSLAVPASFVRIRTDKLDALMAHEADLLGFAKQVDQWAHTVAGAKSEILQIAKRQKSAGHAVAAVGGAFNIPDRHGGEPTAELERLDKIAADLGSLQQRLRIGGGRVSQVSSLVAHDLIQLRMVPFAEACQGLARSVRDVATTLGKKATLTIEGEQIELDRALVEGIRDAFLHLIRNSLEYGIESPAARANSGKPEEGRITIRAELLGGKIFISVEDDGTGLDLDAIRAKANELGLPKFDRDDDAARLVFVPGFSTAAQVTEISGRGIGLDAVKIQIERFHGTIAVSTARGEGTRFVITLPLTLILQRGIVATAADERYVLLETFVRKVLRVDPDVVIPIGDMETIPYEHDRLPVVLLSQLTGVGTEASSSSNPSLAIVVIGVGDRQVGLIVDAFSSLESLVIKDVPLQLGRDALISGVSSLDDGQVALVLNGNALLDQALAQGTNDLHLETRQSEKDQPLRVLLAEDSVTSRALITSLLEFAGFTVMSATDGDNAWGMLQEHPVDVVVSDVEMPNASGFDLLQRIRSSSRLKELPVVLLTALESDEDRRRGMELGANAYLVKRTFDQSQLIETLKQWF